MAKQEVPLGHLQDYLPAGTMPAVVSFLEKYHVHLTVTRERKTVLGDYRHKTGDHHHRISVNGNLNPWSFLVTLLHELAHLLCFEQYKGRVAAHGAEWKRIYGSLLASFLRDHIFPADIEKELQQMLVNPGASSCAEDGLVRVLRRYDKKTDGVLLVEELLAGDKFVLEDGRIFILGEKLRKRYKCQEIKTGKWYLFSPVYAVRKL